MLDLALTEVDGQITLHTANCPEARMMAFLGFPVATMFGCEREPMDVRRHSCLDPSDDAATLRPTRRTDAPADSTEGEVADRTAPRGAA